MAGKNLTFKLVMDADTKGLVTNVKQSEKTVTAALQAIKNGTAEFVSESKAASSAVDGLGTQSQETAQQVKKLDAELVTTNIDLKQTETFAQGATKEIQGLKTGFNAVTSALAALGIGATAQEIAQTADEFKVLEARIGLATSKSGNFKEAFEGVKKIAVETRSDLTATAELFTRVKSAVDQLGYSQERALGITDLVNKSLIAGGGLAASNEAAIYQFNQALQSGVLRGEEFNSVMEQAPRLANALADGLGVNIGKLREMAGQGKLTSDVIVKALESQSDDLNKEFAKMPVTIGQSITNLKTAWTLYIGEADAATGASAKVADAIKFVAENLDEIVGTLTLAAQAFIAYKALNIANTFLDKAAGVRAAQIAITQETTAVITNTQAQLANATATRTAAVAKTQLATNSAAATTATVATGGSIMTLIGRLGALGVAVTAMGLLVPTVFEPIGTYIGEGIAKLQGYGEAFEKLDQQMALDAARAKVVAESKLKIAAAAEKSTEKTYQLTEQSKKLVAEFDALIKKGESAADSLEKVSKSLTLDSTKGINNSITALYLLEQQGKITAEQLQSSIKQAMNDKDLVVFATNAKAAFTGTSFEAQKMALIAEQAMVLAVERTGLSFEQLQGKGSAASRSLINDVQTIVSNLDTLKDRGIDTGLALNMSISKAIDSAETEQQLGVIRAQVTSLKDELGKTVSGGLLDQIERQSITVKANLDQLKSGINSLNEAFSVFGIQSKAQADQQAKVYQEAYQEMIKSGQATTGQMKQALQKMSADIYASGNAAKIAWYEAQLGLQGMVSQIDEFGNASASLDKTDQAIKQIGQSARVSAQQLSEMNNQTGSNSKHGKDTSWEDFKSNFAKKGEVNRQRLEDAKAKSAGGLSSVPEQSSIAALAPQIEPITVNTEPLEATSLGTVQVDLRTNSGTKSVQVAQGSEGNLLDALKEMKRNS